MDQLLIGALRQAARGQVDVVVNLATVRGVEWKDALDTYPAYFEEAAADLLERVAKRREQPRR